jgi:glycosyltransferase involved in cell wall biosynthesis
MNAATSSASSAAAWLDRPDGPDGPERRPAQAIAPAAHQGAAAGHAGRVLFVVNNAAFFESHRLPVAQHAQAQGYEVGLCVGREASATLAQQALPRLAAAGLLPHRVAFRSSGLNPFREALGLLQLVLHVRRFKPDVVHCASPKGLLYGGIAARLAGVPALVMAVSGMGYAYTNAAGAGATKPAHSLPRRIARAVYDRLSHWAYGHPNKRVIVQNADDQRAVCERGLARANEVSLIPGSGVVLDDHLPAPLAGRERLVVLPARMLRDKGVVEFAQAAKLLRESAPGWRFVLAGTADYDNPSAVAQAQIEAWQRAGDIEWLGHVSNMPALYAKAAIVCLPSYREGMPRVLLEAAAAGCAIVTTDAIGCRDAIENGVTGDLVPPQDAAALALVLLGLITDQTRRLRYAAAGRERAKALFGIHAVLDKTVSIYRELQSTTKAEKMSAKKSTNKLVLVQLNELSFDTVRSYIQPLGLRSFEKMLAGHFTTTAAEDSYELLEPWIQWPSVYNGQSAAEHGLTRLGDAVGHHAPQVFEELEAQGVSVGCVAAFSAENRLQKPAYFLPDPWTCTPSDRSWWSRVLSASIGQIVNDNAHQRVTLRSLVHLALGVLRFARPRHYGLYLKLAATARGASWRKALFLDVLLHDMHWCLFHSKGAQFSTVFLNAGAHIQHHYFLNARALPHNGLHNPADYVAPDVDPVAEMLVVYDRLLADYLQLPEAQAGTSTIIATGLSQKPYDREKHYWRLRDHASFLQTQGIRFSAVRPRMSRDFLLEFAGLTEASRAEAALAKLTVFPSGERLFGEIDNRGDSLFVTLTYPGKINPEMQVLHGAAVVPLAPAVALVAMKNGMHQSEGYAHFSSGVAALAPADGAHVKALHQTIHAFFNTVPHKRVGPAQVASPARAAAQAIAAISAGAANAGVATAGAGSAGLATAGAAIAGAAVGTPKANAQSDSHAARRTASAD